MESNTKESLKMIRDMVMVYLYGKTEEFMMDSGKMGNSTGGAFLKIKMALS